MKEYEIEKILQKLEDPEYFNTYKKKYENYAPGVIATILGTMFVGFGNLLYGKEPSYKKFRALEVIARIPYQSISVACYTLLTLFYADEKKAVKYSKRKLFADVAQDNETMHVVEISCMVKKRGEDNFLTLTLIPLVVSFFYFLVSYVLNLFTCKPSLELNYLFESHAFEQYDTFIKKHEESLKNTPMKSEYLDFYGRSTSNEYEFFKSVRNDELIHRNTSIEQIT